MLDNSINGTLMPGCTYKSLWGRILELEGVQQNPHYHPEGNVCKHTLHTVVAGYEICKRENLTPEEQAILIDACWLHDIGKLECTVVEDGVIKSPGHAEMGAGLVLELVQSSYAVALSRLVRYHHAHLNLHSKRAYNRLERKMTLGNISLLPLLILLVEADHSGRPPLEPESPLLDAIVKLGL